ncbi:hypothetical protein C2845_PM05G09620 [Panicum miliaceum]|uniref:DUF1664 domain-containing protein n=1 Tax=Panicum miliaceum TaxID=4540 RepID=A0A3L6T096_PANMI|nr:hypothetical protein C2845_PM05G09620 [Panicum miliaceum]
MAFSHGSKALPSLKKHGKDGGDAKSGSDQHTAQSISQVNNLREQVQYLASRPVTVVTSATKSGPGACTITAIVVAGVIGYAYIKWKGWKPSDMMFVTKRGLSDACNVVGSQLDQVSDTVVVTRKHLAGRIDRVHISLDETQQIIEGTRDEVTVIHGDLSAFQEDLQSVNLVVRTLESKMGRLESSQVSSSIPASIEHSSERIVREQKGVSRTWSTSGEGLSPVMPTSTETRTNTANPTSSSRFGGLRLPGLSFFRAPALS